MMPRVHSTILFNALHNSRTPTVWVASTAHKLLCQNAKYTTSGGLYVHQLVCPSSPEKVAYVVDKMVVLSLQFNGLIGWDVVESASVVQLINLQVQLQWPRQGT